MNRLLLSTAFVLAVLTAVLPRGRTAAAPRPDAPAETDAKLSKALTLHASFDTGLDADFSRGDKTCYIQQGKELVKLKPNEEVKVVSDAGRFGGALHFP